MDAVGAGSGETEREPGSSGLVAPVGEAADVDTSSSGALPGAASGASPGVAGEGSPGAGAPAGAEGGGAAAVQVLPGSSGVGAPGPPDPPQPCQPPGPCGPRRCRPPANHQIANTISPTKTRPPPNGRGPYQPSWDQPLPPRSASTQSTPPTNPAVTVPRSTSCAWMRPSGCGRNNQPCP